MTNLSNTKTAAFLKTTFLVILYSVGNPVVFFYSFWMADKRSRPINVYETDLFDYFSIAIPLSIGIILVRVWLQKRTGTTWQNWSNSLRMFYGAIPVYILFCLLSVPTLIQTEGNAVGFGVLPISALTFIVLLIMEMSRLIRSWRNRAGT